MFSHIKTPFLITSHSDDGIRTTYDIKVLHNDCMFFNFLIQTSRIHWRKELEVELPKLSLERQEAYKQDYKFAIDGPLLNSLEQLEQKQCLINKIFAIGYLLYTPKDRSRAWAVVPIDIAPEFGKHRRGGTGKSLTFNYAFKAYKQSVFHLSPFANIEDNPHVFHGLTTDYSIILMDGLSRKFKIQSVFEIITGDIRVNPKGKESYSIPFEKSPKLVIIPDRAILDDPSTQRRFLYVKFSDYYRPSYTYNSVKNIGWTPFDDFGKDLFDGFDLNDHAHFYQTMEGCINFYMLKPEKINPPIDRYMEESEVTNG